MRENPLETEASGGIKRKKSIGSGRFLPGKDMGGKKTPGLVK